MNPNPDYCIGRSLRASSLPAGRAGTAARRPRAHIRRPFPLPPLSFRAQEKKARARVCSSSSYTVVYAPQHQCVLHRSISVLHRNNTTNVLYGQYYSCPRRVVNCTRVNAIVCRAALATGEADAVKGTMPAYLLHANLRHRRQLAHSSPRSYAQGYRMVLLESQ